MPTRNKFGSGSARGFGLGAGGGKTLITYTAPVGTTTWVCPAGVTLLTRVRGTGANATDKTWALRVINQTIVQSLDGVGRSNPPYLNWSTVKSAADNAYNTISSGSGTRNVSVVAYPTWYLAMDDSWSHNSGSATTVEIRGTPTFRGVAGNQDNATPTSGNVLHSYVDTKPGSWAGWETKAEKSTEGAAGADTTAFGLVCNGGTYYAPTGTGNNANMETFYNIAVTPGTSYTLVNKQFLEIQYYA